MELAHQTEPNLLAEILNELRKTRSMTDDIWAADEIADFLKLSKNTVQGKILDKDNFPQPIILPSGGRRWLSKEVRAWAIKRR